MALRRFVGCLLLAVSAAALEFMFYILAVEHMLTGLGETYWPGIIELEALGLAALVTPLPLAAIAFDVKAEDYGKWARRVATVVALMSAASFLFFFR